MRQFSQLAKSDLVEIILTFSESVPEKAQVDVARELFCAHMIEDGDSTPNEDPFPDNMEPPELLMEATVRVLAEEGVQGLTLRKVAEKSGKNRGLVHYYFESKADLLASLFDHILDGTTELIGISEEDEPIEKLWTVLKFHAYGPGGLDEAGRHYYLAILQLQALAANDPAIRDRLTRNHQYVVDLVASILKEGIEEGVFRSVDPELTAMFFVTTIDGARNVDLSTDINSARETALACLGQWMSELVDV